MKTKNILLSIMAAVLLLNTGCEDDILIKSNPNQPSIDDFYKTPAEAELAINSAYSALQFFGVYNRYWNYSLSARSDESIFTTYQSGLLEVQGLDNFSMTADLQAVKEIWSDNYGGVLKANMVLKHIPEIEFADSDQKDRIMGEAYFLRALYHFNLIRSFGEEIPMYTEVPASEDDFYPASELPGLIYDQIIADFTMAKDLLPIVETYRGTDFLGKISKGAATSFLGKVYLFRGEYQLAADEFSDVISDQVGHYELVERFRDNHDNNNENNLESIFEVQYDPTTNPTDGVWQISYESENASESQVIEQGQCMIRGTGLSWYNMAPSEVTRNEFETTDPRWYKTVWCSNGDTYDDFGINKTYEQIATGVHANMLGWRKWGRDYATDNWECDVNVRVMRLSDVYLMYAECLIEGANGTGTPEQYINRVRDRARNIPDAGKYPIIGTAVEDAASFPLEGLLPTVEELIASAPVINGRTINNIREALHHERMVELACEGKRWDDIVRWGIGKDVCGEHYKDWLPIFQGDLDTNPNLKPNSSN